MSDLITKKIPFISLILILVLSYSYAKSDETKLVTEWLMEIDKNVSTKKHAKCIAKGFKEFFTPELWKELVELSKNGETELDIDTKLRIGLPLGQQYLKCGVPLN
tara:strand:- start:10 stop:324 length:315 start_codon:yes stop_codon:yes gene_type:complete